MHVRVTWFVVELFIILLFIAGFGDSDRGGMREDREDRDAYRRGTGDCEHHTYCV